MMATCESCGQPHSHCACGLRYTLRMHVEGLRAEVAEVEAERDRWRDWAVSRLSTIMVVEARAERAEQSLAAVRAHYLAQPEEGYQTTMRELLGIEGSTPGSTEADS